MDETHTHTIIDTTLPATCTVRGDGRLHARRLSLSTPSFHGQEKGECGYGQTRNRQAHCNFKVGVFGHEGPRLMLAVEPAATLVSV